MGSTSLTGQDLIQVDDRVLRDLADQDPVVLTFPNDIAAAKASKNGNTLFAQNESGRQAEVALRVLLGSADDKYLAARMQEQFNGFSDFILLTGTFSKRVGDGQGAISTKVYAMSGGIFKKQVEAKTSAEGDTEQSVSVYSLAFGSCQVSVQ